MKQILSVFLVFLISASSFSQNFKVSGTLIDKETRDPLEAATVFMETLKDSTLITYTITNRDGKFVLEGNTSVKKARVNISFVGYESFQKEIDLNKPVQDLGSIPIAVSVASLDEVIVKSRAPVTIKKDTLEFNVASFKTKKDATIEDLLKELPGVEVDPDGKIKVNGKEVKNVMVNGKPFFGDDPTIATRNLTKEIIEKVQVMDTKTKAEAFTGETGDQDSKTINLTIKEENNKGIFGRVAAGGGTDKRFEYAGLFNYFDNDRRLSVLGGGNNTNSPGFSFGEIQKMFGGGGNMSMSSTGAFSIDGRSFGYGEGIVNSRIAGANYADVIKKKTDVTANYFYSGSSSYSDSKIERENILPDRSYFTDIDKTSDSETDSHTVNLGFDIKIDSTFLINIKPTLSYNKLKGNRQNESASMDEDRVLTNSANAESSNDMESRKFENIMDFTKKYGSGGGFVKFNFTNEWNNTEAADYLLSETLIYGETPSAEIRDQYTDSKNDATKYVASVTYRTPLFPEKLFMDLKYHYDFKQNLNTKTVFDFDESRQNYSLFNTTLSTDYTFKNTRSIPYASLVFKAEKISLEGGVGYVFQKLEGKDGLRPELKVDNRFEAFQMYARGNVNFSSTARLYLGYTLRNEAPQIEQLLPSTDVSDPLNIITGNPDLKPVNSHSLYLNFNNYNFQKGVGYYAYLNAEIDENAVVSQTIVDENNIRQTTYANVKGAYNISGSLSANRKFDLDSLVSIKPRIGVWSNYSQDINFSNGIEYQSHNYSITPNMGLSLSWQKILDIRTSYSVRIGKNSFENNLFEDRNYISHFAKLGTSLFVPKNFEWRNDIDFSYNPDIAEGFQKSAWFWNSTLAYSMLKEQGTLTLKIYDLLNQNTNARRTSSENFIQDSQSTVLQQYFMLSFSYKFNTLGSKGDTGGSPFHFD
ncbi:outer membrane beta-barrel protein [Aequorivita capsosiphonis]|uniref:outer membrane beta-barrel protein n=1 Tax=Aequorivita capsosiphonis TaxID=487317 RepID=UPI0004021B51|nr:outer membrane beta-barrel protein [Aequorivita capsosiphonis]